MTTPTRPCRSPATDCSIDAEVAVEFQLLEADTRERALRHASVGPEQLRQWMLEQLGAETGGTETHDAMLAGRRGGVGLALATPDQVVDRGWLERLQRHARAERLDAIELLGFEWAADPDADTPDVIAVEVGRGLFEASVRATAWVDGGAGAWERPRIELECAPLPDGRIRIELVDIVLRRPEHLPASVRARPFANRLLGWSIADAAAPTRPMFVQVRKQGRGALERVAELARPDSGVLVIACEDLLGHRHVRRFVLD